jgi:hypothetical protein
VLFAVPLSVLTFDALTASSARAAAPRVEFDIVTDEGLPADAVGDWYQVFSELKVRQADFHSSRGQQKLEIETVGKGSAYVVHGRLTKARELILPGARFGLRDRERLATWIERLASDGPSDPDDTRAGAFGMTAAMLDKFRTRLSKPLSATTAGRSPREVVDEIAESFDLEIISTSAARGALGHAAPLADEMQGLAAGTVLAAALRAGGFGFAPQRGTGERLRLALVPLDAPGNSPSEASNSTSAQVWPVGWSADERRRELVPKFFEFLNVEIDGVSVGEAVASIGPRLEVPMLYDRAAMARHKIDVAAIDAAVPAKRTSYSLLLQKLLFQARLKYQLRVDDGRRPFVWITTIKK